MIFFLRSTIIHYLPLADHIKIPRKYLKICGGEHISMDAKHTAEKNQSIFLLFTHNKIK